MSNDVEMPYRDASGVQRIPPRGALGPLPALDAPAGNNPTAKVLFLRGGPSATHEYFEPTTISQRIERP
jgi:proline iminopeptidase